MSSVDSKGDQKVADDHEKNPATVAAVPELTEDIYAGNDAVDSVYLHKARVLNDSLQEIGMGKYQVKFPPNETLSMVSYHTAVGTLCRRWIWMACVSPYLCNMLIPI